MPGQVDPASDDVGVLEGELAAVTELAFAFRRASSRLREMASEEYLQAHWEEHAERYRDHGTSILRYVGATHPDGGDSDGFRAAARSPPHRPHNS